MPISDPSTSGRKRMVSLLLPQKTTTVLTHHEHKENDVVEEPVDVEDKALTCKGKFHELEKKVWSYRY